MIYQVLSTEGFAPANLLFPISAAIVRDRRTYNVALEAFSESILPFIDWHWTATKKIKVENDTANLYRYFDATLLVEFLYSKVAETIRKDLKEELDFVGIYDGALTAVRDIIDMPDRRASLFVRLCLQNGGRLSRAKRAEFKELTDTELASLHAAIRDVMAELTVGTGPDDAANDPS